MEISEITENEQSSSSNTYTFEPIDFDWKKSDQKNINEYFKKWGLEEHFKQYRFRFNLKFSELNPEKFLNDFFNDQNVRNTLNIVNFRKKIKNYYFFGFFLVRNVEN